jgi:hypothetical protein
MSLWQRLTQLFSSDRKADEEADAQEEYGIADPGEEALRHSSPGALYGRAPWVDEAASELDELKPPPDPYD